VLCVLLPSLLVAQTTRKTSAKGTTPAALKLLSIKVTGSQRYTPEEIAAASGLQIGQTVTEDDFKQAVRHLGETGAFGDVTYSYQYSVEGAKLELQVSDVDRLVPAQFENFVWFSERELQTRLHDRVPLFKGSLPPTGNLADQVSQALQGLLIERHEEGRADYLRSGPSEGPIDAFLFSVSGPNVRIRNLVFTGAGPDELPLLQTVAERLKGEEYFRSVLRVQANKNLLPVYLARGYLKAEVGDPQAKVAEESTQETNVDVTFAVEPGRQYKLADVQWSGNKVFPTDKLQPLLHLQPGQPVNAVQLARDLKAVAKLYGARGYMAAEVDPAPQFDDALSTVSYRLPVHEGDVYHMGDLDIEGLDPRTTRLLALRWKLQAGDTYDGSYPQRFLDEALKDNVISEELNVTVHESPDPAGKTIDVTFQFNRKSSE